MLYELVNPSDQVTFEATNEKIACFCAWSLSWAYWVTDQKGKSYWIPAFNESVIEEVLGPSDWMENFVKENKPEIKKCFLSFFYGSFWDHEQYKKALDCITDNKKKKEFMDHNEDRRSSMSRIVNRAREHGNALLD